MRALWSKCDLFCGMDDLVSSVRPEIILLEGQIIRSPTDQDEYYIKIMICSAIVGGES